jgi:hypothetical protein
MLARLSGQVSPDVSLGTVLALLLTLVALSTPSAVAYAKDIRFLDPTSNAY